MSTLKRVQVNDWRLLFISVYWQDFFQQWATFARVWHVYDAAWQNPFHSANLLKKYLMGMHKPIYHPMSLVIYKFPRYHLKHWFFRWLWWSCNSYKHIRRCFTWWWMEKTSLFSSYRLSRGSYLDSSLGIAWKRPNNGMCENCITVH